MKSQRRSTSSARRCRLTAIGLALLAALPARAVELPPQDGSRENRLGLVFSADGETAYWTEWDGRWGSAAASPQTIVTANRVNGSWTPARPMPFSGDFPDSDPFVSPDGEWLYFASDRPGHGSTASTGQDIWRYRLGTNAAPERLGINSDAREYSPVITADGTLYFASDRTGGQGQGDLYRAVARDGGFEPPTRLGPAFNTPTGEWNLWVSASATEILFEASSRASNVAVPGDLYYSWQSAAGWTPAVPVTPLNGRGSDLMPRLHPDGETLVYTSAPIGGHAKLVTARWPALRAALRTSFAPELIVANRSSHDVVFVNLARGEVVARVPTGAGPHLLSNVSDGRVLATGYGQFPEPHVEPVNRRPAFVSEPNSRLTLIDMPSRRAVADFRIDRCESPHASWIVDDRAYVTCEDETAVVVVDLTAAREISRIDTRQQGSHVLAYEAGSGVLVVSNVASGSATLIDIEREETTIVTLDAGSEGLLTHRGTVWVANGGAGTVAVIDPDRSRVVATTDTVCAFPIAMSANSAATVWVACFASSELVALDSASLAVQRRLKLDGQPLNLLLHPLRDLAYVSLPRANAIAEIDLLSGLEVRRVRTGIEPDGLRWAAAYR